MKPIKFLQALSVTAATFGILLPLPTIANATENARANRQLQTVQDLALGAGGVLRGQVVNKDGLPERDASVSVLRDGDTFATVKTNSNGEFAIAGIPGGVCAITSEQTSGVVRAWSHGTAPPAARESVLLVKSGQIVRGAILGGGEPVSVFSDGGGCLSRIGAGGLLVLGTAGAIIAIAVSDDDAS